MYKSLTKALAMIAATTEAMKLTSQTQGWNREGAYLMQGETLEAGEYIKTANYQGGKFDKLIMQPDCNLVLYNQYSTSNRKARWSSKTSSSKADGPCHATLHMNGNLAVYNSEGEAIWQSNTGDDDRVATDPYRLRVQQDQNLVLYGGEDCGKVWSSKTFKSAPNSHKKECDDDYYTSNREAFIEQQYQTILGLVDEITTIDEKIAEKDLQIEERGSEIATMNDEIAGLDDLITAKEFQIAAIPFSQDVFDKFDPTKQAMLTDLMDNGEDIKWEWGQDQNKNEGLDLLSEQLNKAH